MTFLLLWYVVGFLGWCVFMVQAVIEDSLSVVVRRWFKDWYFTVPFFFACVAFGLWSFLLAIFFTRMYRNS